MNGQNAACEQVPPAGSAGWLAELAFTPRKESWVASSADRFYKIFRRSDDPLRDWLDPACMEKAGREYVDTLLLRGLNRSGLEYSEPGEDGFLHAASLSPREFARMAREWSCDIVRIPFNQDWAMRGRGIFTGEDYLRALDRVIAWAAKWDMYTLLDLQWLQADTPYGPNRQFIAPLPDAESAVMWRMLAERSRALLNAYRAGRDVDAACPLQRSLAKAAATAAG